MANYESGGGMGRRKPKSTKKTTKRIVTVTKKGGRTGSGVRKTRKSR